VHLTFSVDQMRRRDFIAGLGVATTLRSVAWAEQSDHIRRVAYVTSLSESDPEQQRLIAAFRDGLRNIGWIEGRNLRLDYRFGGGDSASMPKLVRELMQLHPDVILAATAPAATAARQQTLSLPIVFVQVPDAVSGGYVTNLAHPEGNITGFTNFEFSIGERWLQLMKDCAPTVNRIAVVFDPANPSWAAYLRTIETAAPSFKVQLTPLGVRDAAEVDSNIQAFASEPNGGLIVLLSPVTQTHRGRIIAIAEQRRLPAIYPYRHFAAEGGLLSYGIDLPDLYKQAASYVDRILKGAKPADLPVQLPTKFELVINLKTAKASGFDLPASLVARADEVIE
jgi:putative tryptophan/tyrosine transport system substrate-binding protein